MVHEDHLSSERIRVAIAHDVRVIRDGLASLLLQSTGLTVVELSPQEIGHKEEQQEGSAVDVVLAVWDVYGPVRILIDFTSLIIYPIRYLAFIDSHSDVLVISG